MDRSCPPTLASQCTPGQTTPSSTTHAQQDTTPRTGTVRPTMQGHWGGSAQHIADNDIRCVFQNVNGLTRLAVTHEELK